MATEQKPLMTLTIADASKESQSFSIYIPEIDEVNYVAASAQLDAYKTAVADLSLGTINIDERQMSRAVENPLTYPTDPYAQRELKWRIVYSDDVTGSEYTFLIPAPDLTDNLDGASDLALLTSTDWAAFKSAFEAVALSPAGNAASLVSASLVGRNS